jgi:hypothetical protein
MTSVLRTPTGPPDDRAKRSDRLGYYAGGHRFGGLGAIQKLMEVAKVKFDKRKTARDERA